jgi:AcrR family transcriptional regulator
MTRRRSRSEANPDAFSQPTENARDDASPPASSARGSNSERRAAAAELKDRRALKSKQALHRGLLSLIAEKDFNEIQLDDILERSRISRATFYRHYPTKEALLEHVGTTEIEHLVDIALPLLSSADTRAACIALCRYVDRHRTLWSVLLTGGAAAAMRDIYARLSAERGPEQVDMSTRDIPLDLGASWGVAGTFEILAWWLKQDQTVTVETAASYLDRLVVRPAVVNEYSVED